MGLKRVLLSKLGWLLLSFTVLFLIGMAFNIVPQWMLDTVSWCGANFSQIVLLICFILAVFLIHEFINRKKGA